jgi:hypothetical protein
MHLTARGSNLPTEGLWSLTKQVHPNILGGTTNLFTPHNIS